MAKKSSFKKDKYRKNRGGYSRWLSLNCEKCKAQVAVYQKDGPGILKRLYLDRIVFPASLSGKQTLVCKKCETVLGVPIIYKKENRLAYRLFVGALEKKILKGNIVSKTKI